MKCIECNEHFVPHHKARKLCSAKCQLARSRKRTEAWNVEQAALPRPIIACAACGNSFETRMNMKVCSRECSAQMERMRAREKYWRNPEQNREKCKKWRAKDPESYRKLSREKSQRERAANPDKNAAECRKRREARPQHHSALVQKSNRRRRKAFAVLRTQYPTVFTNPRDESQVTTAYRMIIDLGMKELLNG
jgi:predicted nucleic acid-binding Zn ribbon protein